MSVNTPTVFISESTLCGIIIKKNPQYLLRLFPTFLTFLTLQTYRDGVDKSPQSVNTPSVSFANRYYECNGNEAVLRDCIQNSRKCTSEQRTSLTCKSKLSFIFTRCFRLYFCHYQSVETNNCS